jgi:hypothetical protein
MDYVHELEHKLVIQIPWAPDSDEWIVACEKVQLREYRKAVDRLESLVVAQIFELSKMNMSQTGTLSIINVVSCS